MESRIAKFISLIFNPLIVTSFFLVIALNLQFHFATAIPEKARWMIIGLVITTTFIIPALSISVFGLMLRKKVNLLSKDARLGPLAVVSIFYLLTYHLLDQIQLSPIFNLFILGMSSLSVISMIVLIIGNTSLYMVASGALLGAFTGLHMILNINLVFFIFLSLIIGGLTGFSRLSLGKHKALEIYSGYALGTVVMLVHYLYL